LENLLLKKDEPIELAKAMIESLRKIKEEEEDVISDELFSRDEMDDLLLQSVQDHLDDLTVELYVGNLKKLLKVVIAFHLATIPRASKLLLFNFNDTLNLNSQGNYFDNIGLSFSFVQSETLETTTFITRELIGGLQECGVPVGHVGADGGSMGMLVSDISGNDVFLPTVISRVNKNIELLSKLGSLPIEQVYELISSSLPQERIDNYFSEDLHSPFDIKYSVKPSPVQHTPIVSKSNCSGENLKKLIVAGFNDYIKKELKLINLVDLVDFESVLSITESVSNKGIIMNLNCASINWEVYAETSDGRKLNLKRLMWGYLCFITFSLESTGILSMKKTDRADALRPFFIDNELSRQKTECGKNFYCCPYIPECIKIETPKREFYRTR
jgi:hypothetical protein